MTNGKFTYSIITSHNSVLTKTLKYVHGKLTTTNPALYRGFADRCSATLSELPQIINGLTKNQCIATGWMDTPIKRVEILTKGDFEQRRLEYPVHKDETGVYGTRSKQSMIQKGPSLVMLDYDPDPQSPNVIKDPEDLLKLLDNAMPSLGISKTSYVRDYSTSTALYDKKTHQEIRKPEGFHIYMLINEGQKLEIFAKHLELGCWRHGLGYIKIGASASRLTRTILDLAVFTPERLIYAAGADIPEGETFYQDLPLAEYVEKENSALDIKNLKKLSPRESSELLRLQTAMKESDEVNKLVEKKKQQLKTRLISENVYTSRPLSEKEAIKTINAMSRHVLHPTHVIHFEDDRSIMVKDLIKKAIEFDNVGVLDPLRPEKGFGRAKFYANATEQTPVINSFLEGGRVFNLNDTYNEFIRIREAEHSDLELLTLDPVVINSRYFPTIKLAEGVTLIKGDKGTGKTSSVAEQIRNCSGRVLAISHRVSLVSTLCEDFNLSIYSQFTDKNVHLIRPEARLGICYNSLHRIAGLRYDYLVIDEFMQLVRTIKSGIVRHKFICLKVLRELIQNTKTIVLMDADMSKGMIDFLSKGEYALFPPETKFHVIVNKFKPSADKEIKIYRDALSPQKPDKPSFVVAFREAITETGVFYASNSRTNILFMAAQAVEVLGGDCELPEDHFITEVGGKRVITITAHNSQSKEVQAFIKNINSELRETDIFMSSPSLGTGVSISSVNGKPKLEKVFGYFTKRANNTPSDCLQHMARVRDCNNHHIMIAHYRTNLEVDPIKIIQTEVLGKKGLIDEHLNELMVFDWETGSVTFRDQGWTTYYGELTARENETKNTFYDDFLLQVESEGFKLADASSASTQLCDAMKAYEKMLKQNLKQLEIERILNTPMISDEEFEELRVKTNLTPAENRLYFKKMNADLFGFPRDCQDLNELLVSSKAKIRGRTNSLILGASPSHLALLDILSRLDKNQHAFYIKAQFDKQQLLLGFLETLKLRLVDGEFIFDEEPLTPYELYLAHQYLYVRAKKILILFGSHIVEANSEQEIKKEITKGLKWLSLTWETHSRVLVNNDGVRSRLASLSLESVARLKKDVKRAQKNSKSKLFSPLVRLPDTLRSYVFSLVNGGGYSEYQSFFNSLSPDYKQLVDSELLSIYEGVYKKAS